MYTKKLHEQNRFDIEDILARQEFEKIRTYLSNNPSEQAEQIIEKKEFKLLRAYLDITFSIKLNKNTQDKMNDVFKTHSMARNYFYTRLAVFGNKRPYDLILEHREEEVYSELIRLEHGILS
ncbi:MAG: hypothetical protein WC758_03255 [Candidatus Woesearchaeota archaeon]|jgi:hypothetical protein